MRILIIVALLVGLALIVGWRLVSNPPARRNRSEEQDVVGTPRGAERPPTPGEDPGPATAAGDPAPGSREQRHQHGKP